MGYYQEFALGEEWDHRASITVDNLAGTDPMSIQIPIPAAWDRFWDNVNATDGRDIRITEADGETLVDYVLDSFDQSTHVLKVNIRALSLGNETVMRQLWIYWGNSTAADAQTAGAFVKDTDGKCFIGCPTGRVLSGGPDRPGEKTPSNKVSKTSDETMWVWFDMTDQLISACDGSGGQNAFEEIDSVQVLVTLSNIDDPTLHNELNTVIVEQQGRNYFSVELTTGVADSDYTLEPHVTTTQGRLLNPRALIQVRDPSE